MNYKISQCIYDILEANKNHILSTVLDAAIVDLKNIKVTYGVNVYLTNAWEEICVQVQSGYSIYWDIVYVPTIESVIKEKFEKLSFVEQNVLILYIAFANDTKLIFDLDENDNYDDLDVDIEGALKNEILLVAAEYQNDNIKKYLDSNS